jgi:hypothetical protein
MLSFIKLLEIPLSFIILKTINIYKNFKLFYRLIKSFSLNLKAIIIFIKSKIYFNLLLLKTSFCLVTLRRKRVFKTIFKRFK